MVKVLVVTSEKDEAAREVDLQAFYAEELTSFLCSV
jgi:hypothetical protein